MKQVMGLMFILAAVSAFAGSGIQELRDGGGPIPTCYPGLPQCPNGSIVSRPNRFDGGGPIPTCYPGRICK